MKLKRIHDTLTFHIEKRLLDRIAKGLYHYVNADQLSILALCGAIIAGYSYIIATSNLQFLHIANFGIFIHWFGDSLDGRVANLRHENRPNLGHYIDHILDAVSAITITFGITYSGLTNQSSWVWVLALFLLIMIHSFLKASVTGDFELSFERFGPTEARIGLILINIVTISSNNILLISKPIPLNVLDLCGSITALILLLNLLKTLSSTLWGKNRIHETDENNS